MERVGVTVNGASTSSAVRAAQSCAGERAPQPCPGRCRPLRGSLPYIRVETGLVQLAFRCCNDSGVVSRGGASKAGMCRAAPIVRRSPRAVWRALSKRALRDRGGLCTALRPFRGSTPGREPSDASSDPARRSHARDVAFRLCSHGGLPLSGPSLAARHAKAWNARCARPAPVRPAPYGTLATLEPRAVAAACLAGQRRLKCPANG